MDENEITQRLRDAGDQPVPGEVRATHLSQMHAAVPVAEKPKRFGRLAVAAAAFVGFAVGSTGFAMAGALPAPAQGVAHDVLSVVQVEVPDRKDNRGKCISEIANDPERTPEQKKIDKAGCEKGKPAHAEGRGKGKGNGGGPPDAVMNDNDPCKGPPPWAGKSAQGDKAAEKEAHRAARAGAGCANEPDDAASDEAEKAEEQQEKDAEALEEQRKAEAEEQTPPAPAEQAPTGEPGAQGQGEPPVELPGPIDGGDDAGADAQDTPES